MEKKNTHIAYGFITGIVIVILNLILYVTNLAFKPGMSYLSEIPFLIGIILNGIAFSKANDGYVTFGNVFSSCFKACAIVALVSVVWAFISLSIFPEMQQKAIEMARSEMVKKNLTDDQIDQSIAMTQKFFKVFVIAGAIFGTMIIGAIFSLISAAVARKKGVNPVEMQA